MKAVKQYDTSHFKVSMALVAQVSYITSHKFAVNSGFQVNYGLPFSLQGIYKPPFWGRSTTNGTSFVDSFFIKMIEGKDETSEESNKKRDDDTTTIIPDDPTTRISKKKKAVKKSKRDVSAGEFYNGVNEAFKM